jgi:hypothetical protein
VIFSCLKELAKLMTSNQNQFEDELDVQRSESSSEVPEEAAIVAAASQKKKSGSSSRFFGSFMGKSISSSTSSNSSTKKEETDQQQLSDEMMKPAELKGLIEHVVLLGAPVSCTSSAWPVIREMVGGRVINGYSSKDLVLGVIYR